LGIFKPSKEEQFARAQLKQSQEAMDLQYAAQSMPAKVSEEPQVSWRILDNEDFFLTWRFNPKTNEHIKAEKDMDLIEPCGSEPLAFLEPQKNDRELLNEIDSNLTGLYNYMEKYGREERAVRLFNTIARYRIVFLNNSRATGKAGKLAKSQFVDSKSTIAHGNVPKPKRGGGMLGGLFG